MTPATAQAALDLSRVVLLGTLLVVCNRLGCAVAWEAADAGRWGLMVLGTAGEWGPVLLAGWAACGGWSEVGR